MSPRFLKPQCSKYTVLDFQKLSEFFAVNTLFRILYAHPQHSQVGSDTFH